MARLFTSASSMKLEKSSAVITAVPITLSCWFRPASTGVTSGLFGFYNVSTDTISLEVLSTNFLAAKVRDAAVAGTARATSSTSISANTWYHGCAVFTSSTSRDIYTNGGGSASNTTAVTPSVNLTAAAYHGQGSFADGRIADCAAWNVALTTNEITALAAGMSPLRIRRASLMCYYPLYGFQSPEQDIIGANSMTLSNSPTQANHPPVGTFSRRIAFNTNGLLGTSAPPVTKTNRMLFIGAGAGA